MMRWLTVLALTLVPAYAAAADAGGPALAKAVKAGDRAAIRTLLRGGADVSATEMDGTTALHWAAHNGDLETVKALIALKADVNAKNRYGIAPIWPASMNGHADVVDALLRAGADPEVTRAASGETPLMAAAMGGYVSTIQRLLAFGADPNVAEHVRHQTPLMWAAAEHHKAAAQVLVESGANLEARSNAGMTPLMFAIRSGDIPTVQALLDLGADLKATAPDGTTSLVLAILNAHWELASTLIDRGADANGQDPRGRPLHVLAFARRAHATGLSKVMPRRPTGNIDTIELARRLLAHGAGVNATIDWKNASYVPTQMAISEVHSMSYVGATPLFIAAKNCDVEFVRFLLANGADPKPSTIQGFTPLLAAAGVGLVIGESPGTPEEAFETVKILAALGNDVNAGLDLRATDTKIPRAGAWNGAGALHGAVIRGANDLVAWLIAQGVQLDRKTTNGKTPLDLARGTTIGINYEVWPELAVVLENAMRAKGLPIPEKKNNANIDQLGAE